MLRKLRVSQFLPVRLASMSQEAQLGEVGVKLEPDSGIEGVLELKNNLIKSLRYDLGKVIKVIVQPGCLAIT